MNLELRTKATLRRTFLAGGVLVAASTFSPIASARPGTPTELTAYVEDHRRIAFSFRNTASEPVVFDFDVQINGVASPQNIILMNCGAPEEANAACLRTKYPQSPFARKGEPLTLSSNRMGPGAKVCVRVIARQWNNGNPQWGLVSDQWSAWSCGVMKPLPAPPAVPAPPQLQYFAPVAQRGLAGQVRLSGAYPLPRPTGALGRFDLWSTTEKLVSGAWQRTDLKPASAAGWPLADDGVAAPGVTNPLAYRVCVSNDGGTRCSASAQVYSDAISRVPPPPPPVVPGPPGPPPPPPPPSPGIGTGEGPGNPCTTCNPPGTKPRPIHFQ